MSKRIAISVLSDAGLEATVSPHFGRCPYFTLVDVEGHTVLHVDAVVNPFYARHQPGQVPGFIQSLGAQVMLSGGMGGRAVEYFRQLGIEAVTGAAGTARETLKRYLGGELDGAEACTESVEHGHG